MKVGEFNLVLVFQGCCGLLDELGDVLLCRGLWKMRSEPRFLKGRLVEGGEIHLWSGLLGFFLALLVLRLLLL